MSLLYDQYGRPMPTAPDPMSLTGLGEIASTAPGWAWDNVRGIGSQYMDVMSPSAEATQQSLRGLGVKAKGALPFKLGRGAPLLGSRMAASPKVLNALKILPGLGAVAGVAGAADVAFGPDSAENKAMDAVAMLGGGIGGALGTVGGPVGTAIGAAAGAGLGKMGSDSLQWLFGDKKTAEERRMEEALLALRGAR